jgi:uncharacterized protein
MSLPHSAVRPLRSSVVGDTYQLTVVLPDGYDRSEAQYPVVYAFPASPDLFVLWSITTELAISGELPPVILVGVGYPTHDQNELLRLRIRDHMPWPDADMDSEVADYLGLPTVRADGAANLLGFVRQELIPFLSANYRTIPDDRTFVGMSSGGILGVYALLNHPGLFQRYVCISPPLFRSDRAIFRDEQAYSEQNDDLAARVFLAVGGLEENDPFHVIKPQYHFVSNLVTLAKTLDGRHYPSLDLTWHVFEDETHLSVFPAAYSRGLRYVFRLEAGEEA